MTPRERAESVWVELLLNEKMGIMVSTCGDRIVKAVIERAIIAAERDTRARAIEECAAMLRAVANLAHGRPIESKALFALADEMVALDGAGEL